MKHLNRIALLAFNAIMITGALIVLVVLFIFSQFVRLPPEPGDDVNEGETNYQQS